MPLLLMLLPLPATAKDTRPASEHEIKSFEAFYRDRFAYQSTAEPVLSVTRAAQGKQWHVTATVDSAPQRAQAPLCKMLRSSFVYDTKAPRHWIEEIPAGQYAWFDRGPACRRATEPVKLIQPLPDPHVIALMNQQARLLQSARLLMAGNTSCARQRSLNFKLAGIDIGADKNTAGMFGLVFQSDRDSSATVWVKYYRNDLTAWNVTCPAP
ncbi:hypothetical protein [Janthinobacterium agaricidamnosum]|uniref:hypothetical protein n=1 Tax=Janthinobacterium agaricidamnosum TaxID=55508 RepID=UPI0011872677|nr:hypothetical protein [Janthinobacterium agaricidamnosum]